MFNSSSRSAIIINGSSPQVHFVFIIITAVVEFAHVIDFYFALLILILPGSVNCIGIMLN